uniref:Wsv139-like protein n=1 Tax=Hemigrapsus takanoi nimavirus TaxID=2133792 RepID=A0A401IP49_9VIRU|nr:MAG: wsv139-like protein [Hemigrapsus takanoi nimavirus]GBG35386.1 wsv139-like protein [Hemigrapsus takanoi nimavirus]
MGVQRAASAYSVIYGPHDRRVHRNNNPPSSSPAAADNDTSALTNNNVCLIDFSTYHVPTLCSVSSRAAAAVMNSDGKLGQMVVFSASGIIYDIMFDENCCISADDVRPGNILNEEDLKHLKNYKRSTSFHNDICINSFCSKFKSNVLSKKNADVTLIPVTAGRSFDTLQKLRDFAATSKAQRNQRPIDLRPMPQHGSQSGTSSSYTAFKDWLRINNVSEATFINFEHVYNAVWKNNAYANTSGNETYMYNCAKMAHETEGFLLLYGVAMINKLKQLSIDKRKNNKFVLFTDGKPPVIKNYTKTKRNDARKNRLKNKIGSSGDFMMTGGEEDGEGITPEMLFREMVVLFERVSMSIPTCLLQCVLLDVLRIPFFNQMKVNDQLFFASSVGSEAEDDIVKITAFAANIDTGVRGDVKTLIKLKKPEDSRPEKIRKIDLVTNSFLREELTWKDACVKTLINSPCTSITIFSYDSDVLPKWNMMVKHSFDNRNDDNGCHQMMKKSAENIESIYFYRSLMDKWTNNNNNDDKMVLGGSRYYGGSDDDEDGGGIFNNKRKSGNAPAVNNEKVSIYDLTQSPVMHSVESTLLLMLINGCDYVDALVSSNKTVSRYDIKIREEVTMFERFACLCRSFEEEEEEGFSKCHKCDNYKVPNLNIIKRFLLKCNVSSIFRDNYPTACNSAANVLAMLSLSCFNQKIFGSVAASRQNNPELSTHILAAKHGFFSEYTQGGIPLCDSTATHPQIESERMEMFRDLGSIKRSRQIDDDIEVYIEDMNGSSVADIFTMIDTEDAKEDDRILSLVDTTTDVVAASLTNISSPSSMAHAAAEAIDTSRQDCPSLAICFDRKHKKREGDSSADDEEEDIIEAILAKSKKRLKKDDVFDTTMEDNTPSLDSLVFSPDKSLAEPKNFTDETTITTTIVPPSPSPEKIIKKIDSAMMCEDTPSHAGTEDYILSLLTTALKAKVKVLGLDDKRTNNMTYCGKVMDLLIVLYLNMCGQQDPTVSHYQYIPVIHNELISQAASTGSPVGTTRSYFVAAINELSFYMYRPELKETSKYSQTRRQRWKAMAEKLMGFDNEMRACGVRTPCDNGSFIRPVYGLVRVKPWSALSLLGARLYFKHKFDI